MISSDPRAHRTYSIYKPPDITIPSTCYEVGCEYYRRGWQTVLDESTPRGAALANYIRHGSGRTFRELHTGPAKGGLTVFRFEPGQRCFEDHHSIPETFARFIGAPFRPAGDIYTHARGIDWVEDFTEHTEKIKEENERG